MLSCPDETDGPSVVLNRLAAILTVPAAALSASLPLPTAHAVTTPRPAHTTLSATVTTPPRHHTGRPARDPHRVPLLSLATAITDVAASPHVSKPRPAYIRPVVKPAHVSKPPDPYVDAPHTHAGLVAWSRTLPWPWPGIIHCESIRDDSWPVSSSSRARGILQFLPSTWRSLGYTGDPASYSWRFQYRAALRLEARDGLGAWDCARILGIAH